MPSYLAPKSAKKRSRSPQHVESQHASDVTMSGDEFEEVISAGFVPGGGIKSARIEMTQRRMMLASSTSNLSNGYMSSEDEETPSTNMDVAATTGPLVQTANKQRRRQSMVITSNQRLNVSASRISVSDSEDQSSLSSGSDEMDMSQSQSTIMTDTSARSKCMPKWLLERMKNLYVTSNTTSTNGSEMDDGTAITTGSESGSANSSQESENDVTDDFESALYAYKNPFELEHPTNHDEIVNFMDEDDVMQQYQDAYNAAPPDVCDLCQQPLIFTSAGDGLVCNTPLCSTHVFPICEGTVASLPFGEEIYFTAAFSHNNAAKTKSTQAVKRENDIFGKTKTVISDKVVDYMRMCIQQSLGKTRTSEITINDVYACAKVHGWTELYHEKLIPVFCRMTGRKMPDLVEEDHVIATNMYLMVRDAYNKGCKPADRKNFMDYLYLWYKIYDLIGATHLLPYIRLLDAKNLATQDAIFHDICKHLDWKFTPTIPRAKPAIIPLTHLLVKTSGVAVGSLATAGLSKKQPAIPKVQPAMAYEVVSMEED
jgi:hypothetical protein